MPGSFARIHSFANVRFHQSELQEIADVSGGTRASGTPGYNRSAQYVARALRAADYQVRVQRFQFPFFPELADPEFAQISPNSTMYPPNDPAGFFTLQYSGSDDVEAEVEAVDVTIPPTPAPSSTSGCEAADFAGFTAGNIALVQRGTCFFIDKVLNAQAAGASAVIMFNEGQADLDRVDAFTGTLGEPVGVPVIGTSFAIGSDLYDLSQTQSVTARVAVTALSEPRVTMNVFGDTKFGSNQHVVVVGAHLDSVLEGTRHQRQWQRYRCHSRHRRAVLGPGPGHAQQGALCLLGRRRIGPIRLPALCRQSE